MPTIRLAEDRDAEQIQAIYAPIVRDTIISFEIEVPTVEEMRHRLQQTLTHFPWLVYEREHAVVGYVYASKHRERFAYQWSVDVSAYVHTQRRRMGIGRALYASLFGLLALQGFFNAYAGITVPNDASIGLHRAVGFQPVGIYQHVGYKLGAWRDVSWWSLSLQPLHDNPLPPLDFQKAQTLPGWNCALNAGSPDA